MVSREAATHSGTIIVHTWGKSMAGTFTQLAVHFVFSTKHRVPIIVPDLRTELHNYIGGIIRNHKGTLIEIGGMPDHLHIACLLHPASAPSDMMRLVKANSSKWVNDQPARTERFEWQDGFGAFSVSKSNLPAVAQYIRTQETHHRTMTFQDEFLAFLKRHEIDFDPLHIWD